MMKERTNGIAIELRQAQADALLYACGALCLECKHGEEAVREGTAEWTHTDADTVCSAGEIRELMWAEGML